MRIFYIFIFILFNYSALAGLNELVSEALKESKTLELNMLNLDLSSSGIDRYNSQYDWTVVGNLSHNDSFKESLFSFQSLRTISDSLSVSLKRKFSWGGDVSLEQGLRNYNLSKWGSTSSVFTAAGSFDDSPTEYYSKLTYSQDIGKNLFGKSQKLDLKIANADVNLKKSEIKLQEEQLLGSLVRHYTSTRHSLSLIETTKENIKRYKKKMKLIKRRVADGLRLQVDYLQSKNQLLSQEEMLTSYELRLRDNLEAISLITERDIKKAEVNKYSLYRKLEISNWKSWEARTNLELKKTLSMIQKVEAALEKSKRSGSPDIILSASLGTNAIEGNYGEAFEQGKFDSKFQEKAVSLNIVIPIGNNFAKSEIQRSKVQKQQQESILQIQQKSLQVKFNSLKGKIELYVKNIKSVQKRLKLSKEVMASYEKLYLQGRVEFDVLLNSEDRYNLNIIDYYNIILSYENLLLDYSIMTNHFKGYLASYKG